MSTADLSESIEARSGANEVRTLSLLSRKTSLKLDFPWKGP